MYRSPPNLTRKQRAVLRLARDGYGPTKIAAATGMRRESVSRLLSRAKRNLAQLGLDSAKIVQGHELDILELIA